MEELVKRLRAAAIMSDALSVFLPHSEGSAVAKLYNEAADAIEALSMKLHGDEAAIAGMKREIERMVVAGKPRWIPVTERLPEQFKPVLVYYNRNGHSGMGVAEYYHDGDTKVWRGCGFIPTHWMPLPQPPKEE